VHNLTLIAGTNATLRFAIDGSVTNLTVHGNIVIGIGAKLRVETRNPAGAANSYVEHTLSVYGNLTNNGTLDLRGGSTTGGDIGWSTDGLYRIREFNDSIDADNISGKFGRVQWDQDQ
jgi:hypothetical protein